MILLFPTFSVCQFINHYWNSTMYQTPMSTTNIQWYQIKVFTRQHCISLANFSVPQNQWLLRHCQFYCTVGLKLHKPFQVFWGTGYAITSQPHKNSTWNLFSLVLSISTAMEMLEPVQNCDRNENKVRIYQTKRFTSTKIFCAFLYKINRQIP